MSATLGAATGAVNGKGWFSHPEQAIDGADQRRKHGPMRIGGSGVLLIAVVLALSLPAAADVGWVDDDGRVRYGNDGRTAKVPPKRVPSIASCMAAKGVVFYGASWCPQCAKQWGYFGNTAGDLAYVECSVGGTHAQTAECDAQGIQGYPTWAFPDGRHRAGVYKVEVLARLSGCG